MDHEIEQHMLLLLNIKQERSVSNRMLYYTHGYKSSPDSRKGMLLNKTLNVVPIKYREGKPEDLDLSAALHRIRESIKDDEDVIFIGSSLGGYLAAAVAIQNENVQKLVLINPLFIPPDADTRGYDSLPDRLIKEIQGTASLFEEEIPSDLFILLGTNDELIPVEWTLRFATANNATLQLYNDDHRFSQNISRLPELIKNIIAQ